MAQHENAAGDVNEPVDAPATDIFEELADEFAEEEEQPVEGEEPEAEVDEVEDEPEAEELPAIDPPASWKADEKDAFKDLPRAAQEVIARREAERETFVRQKGEEAVRARREAETAAIAQVAEIERQAVARLQTLSAQILPQKPDPRLLQGNDADRAYFYHQQALYEQASAQQQTLQQEAQQRHQQMTAYQQELENREREAFRQTLSEHFPEYLDPAQSAKLQQELGSIAQSLGYSQELIAQAGAADILAMRRAAEWKAKADKLDALNAKKMEAVRAAKGLPKVATAGAAQTRAQTSAAKRNAAWERVKETRDPEAFADFLGL